jgi:hypothetical protein
VIPDPEKVGRTTDRRCGLLHFPRNHSNLRQGSPGEIQTPTPTGQTLPVRYGGGAIRLTARVSAADRGRFLPTHPCAHHRRSCCAHAQWRALSPGEKIERLLNMSLDRAAEILTWPMAELDPLRLSPGLRALLRDGAAPEA